MRGDIHKNKMVKTFQSIFLTPVSSRYQKLIILLVAVLFIFLKENYPLDWDLNTRGFWSNFPDSYQNVNFVYPPWGLILMLPYKWMLPEGAKFFSVLVIGALVIHKKWSLSSFFAIVLSPYFVVTMTKSALDIMVMVFPIYLWEISAGKRWQAPARGLAVSLSMLKPQAAMFIWLYFFWKERKNWKSLIWPLVITAVVIVPISLVGSPPLFLQWIDNLRNPSPFNILCWSMNNFSLNSKITIFGSIGLLAVIELVFFILSKKGIIRWSENLTIASLLYASMAVSPYTSQQSLSSALAFVPSWVSVVLQGVQLLLLNVFTDYRDYLYLEILFLIFISVFYYGWNHRRKKTQL